VLRLRGGAPTVTVLVKPMVQKERWSLYWKESMSTKTLEDLGTLELQLEPSTTIQEVCAAVFLVLPTASWSDTLSHFRRANEAVVFRTDRLGRGVREKLKICKPLKPSLFLRSRWAERLQVQQLVATKVGWEPVEKLLRLEGFKEVWERTLFKGRELQPDQTLESAKLPAGATIAAVRKVLVAEGWKVRELPQTVSMPPAAVTSWL